MIPFSVFVLEENKSTSHCIKERIGNGLKISMQRRSASIGPRWHPLSTEDYFLIHRRDPSTLILHFKPRRSWGPSIVTSDIPLWRHWRCSYRKQTFRHLIQQQWNPLRKIRKTATYGPGLRQFKLIIGSEDSDSTTEVKWTLCSWVVIQSSTWYSKLHTFVSPHFSINSPSPRFVGLYDNLVSRLSRLTRFCCTWSEFRNSVKRTWKRQSRFLNSP